MKAALGRIVDRDEVIEKLRKELMRSSDEFEREGSAKVVARFCERAMFLGERVTVSSGNERVTGSGSGPQAMQARDIDLRVGADGRTLQGARVMENGSVQLPGESSATGRSSSIPICSASYPVRRRGNGGGSRANCMTKSGN